MDQKDILVIIPARGGSKGIPHKNIKLLNGKPLICYAIDNARSIVADENICVTTDDDEIIKVVEDYGLKVPFKRPDYLATDTCGSYEVLLHAYNFYRETGRDFKCIVLLQTTSPFCRPQFVSEALSLYRPEIDMVVSVKPATTNPYYNSFEEDKYGYLVISKGDGLYQRRQDCPKAFEYNGAIYVINPQSILKQNMGAFKKVVKFEMDEAHSLDLDTPIDWTIAEMMIENKMI